MHFKTAENTDKLFEKEGYKNTREGARVETNCNIVT